jgi:hypothetical protein
MQYRLVQFEMLPLRVCYIFPPVLSPSEASQYKNLTKEDIKKI